jgi:uncharacterized membrane protein
MRVLKLVLPVIGIALIGLSLMLGMPGSSQAQKGGGATFKLQVCNKYGKLIALALVNRTAPGENRLVVHGWYGIAANKCIEGDLPQGPLGLFAFADAGNNQLKAWGGDTQICVRVDKNFQRVITPNYRCRRENNETTVGFGVVENVDQPEVSLDLD